MAQNSIPGTRKSSTNMFDELRLGPFRIVHTSSRHRPHQVDNGPDATTALCRVTIADLHHGSPRTLFCQTQCCYLNPSIPEDSDSNGNPHKMFDVSMNRPFSIPAENLMVRKDDGGLDYSPFYQVQLEFEAGYDFSSWPPMNVDEFGVAAEDVKTLKPLSRHIILSSRSHSIKDSLNAPLVLSIGTPSHAKAIQTEYRMECGFNLVISGMIHGTNMSESITASNLHSTSTLPSGGETIRLLSQGTWNGLMETEQEPRTPVSTNLSESRSPEESNTLFNDPKNQEPLHRQFGEVLYMLSAKQRLLMDSFRCIGCGESQESEQQLQTHFRNAHTGYHCVPAYDGSSVYFQVGPSENATSSQTQQPLYIPSIELQRLQNAPEEHSEAMNVANPTLHLSPDAAYYPKSEASRPGAKRTIVPFDDGNPESMHMDSASDIAATDVSGIHTTAAKDGNILRVSHSPSMTSTYVNYVQRYEGSQAESDVFLVPKMKQPLYHPVSKAILKAGDPLPLPDVKKDWVIQQHRGNIAEYTDVTMEEKDYIWKWDSFILRKNITASVYLAPAWLEFVRYNAVWLISSQSRMAEFGNHMAVLLAQDTLPKEAIEVAKRYIQEARKHGPLQAPDNPTLEGYQSRKSASGCTICGLPVRGPKTLLCHNKVNKITVSKIKRRANILSDMPSPVVPFRLRRHYRQDWCKQKEVGVQQLLRTTVVMRRRSLAVYHSLAV